MATCAGDGEIRIHDICTAPACGVYTCAPAQPRLAAMACIVSRAERLAGPECFVPGGHGFALM